ncbi:MAG: GDYXXLXY domain-containing protein [Cyanobacteria bacterium P01_F01_bin.116]
MVSPSSRNNPLIRPKPIKPVPIEPVPKRRLPGWRLWAPLLIQVAMIVAVPAQDAYTYVTGTSVTLQTAPVDPYDFLRGYYQTLRYDISQAETLRTLPGGEKIFSEYNNNRPESFYIVLESPTTETSPPTPWRPIRVSETRPDDLQPNQVSLKGKYTGWQMTYGVERYYMQEAKRTAINADIRNTQRQNQEAFVVDVKVDSRGNAVLVGLWVNDTNLK